MNKKKSEIVLIIIVFFLTLIFLALLFIKLKPKTILGPGADGVSDKYTEVNVDNIEVPEITEPMTPTVISSQNKSEHMNVSEYPEKKEVLSPTFLADSVLQTEQIIIVGSKDFQPRMINTFYNAKVPLVLRATDNNEHVLVLDVGRAKVNLEFSKEKGDLYYNFMGPETGEYAFYIDSPENTGVLKSILQE